MKILIGALAHETNSFCGHNISFESWMANPTYHGEEILTQYRGKPHAIGGMLQALEEGADVPQVIGGADLSGRNVAGGIVDQKVVDTFLEEMLEVIRTNLPLDGVLLSFHGAMQTDVWDDAEGEMAQAIRKAVGEDAVIGVSTDLHAFVSDRLAAAADIVCGYHTYPHVDQYETGYRTAKLVMEKIRGRDLHLLKIRLPMLIPASAFTTLKGPFKEMMEYASRRAQEAGLADFTLYLQQPWLDIAPGGSSVVVLGEDREKMEAVCRDLAERLLALRYKLKPDAKSTDEVLDLALANEEDKPVILVDSADSPNAGASGDSMEVGCRVLERGLSLKTATCVADAPGVEEAFRVGVGGRGRFRLGGTINPTLPVLDGEGYVRSLHDGVFRNEGPAYRGMVQNLGRAAVLSFGPVDVLVCDHLESPGDPQLYRAFGMEPTLYRLVDVKACTSFRAAYEKFTDLIYETDTPGSAAIDLTRLPFRKISRDFWPWSDLEGYQVWEIFYGR